MIEYIKHFVSTWSTNGLVSLFAGSLLTLIAVFFRQIGRFFSLIFKWIWAIVNTRGKDYTFERAYLNWTINQHRYLGLLPARVVAARWGEEGRNVDLEKVYISLHISTQSIEKNWAETSTSNSSSWRKDPWLFILLNNTRRLYISIILTGTYELLALRNLNGQTARRGLEIHFPRYQFQHQPDQVAFQHALLTLPQQIPLEVDTEGLLVKHWPYFYERSIGCIGVLKDWLVRAVSVTMADNQPKLLFERIQECALPLAQCESMAMEAASGEQELRYTASRRQHLWHLLGMTMETEEQQAEPAPPVTSPQNGHPSQGLRVGEPKPQRYEVGEIKKEERAERCSFSHQTIAFLQHS